MAVIISSCIYFEDKTRIISKSDNETISENLSSKNDFWKSFESHKNKITKVLRNKPISEDLIQIQLVPELTEQFFVLNDDFYYQSISAELIIENDNSYFYVQESLISVYGREQVEEVINEEKQRFEEKIYNESIETFGNIEGRLGDIGDGKIVVLIANLPTNVAGYFDMCELSPSDINYIEQQCAFSVFDMVKEVREKWGWDMYIYYGVQPKFKRHQYENILIIFSGHGKY